MLFPNSFLLTVSQKRPVRDLRIDLETDLRRDLRVHLRVLPRNAHLRVHLRVRLRVLVWVRLRVLVWVRVLGPRHKPETKQTDVAGWLNGTMH